MKDYISLYESQKTVEYFGLILTIPDNDYPIWLAVDADGEVYMYPMKPTRKDSFWNDTLSYQVKICRVNLHDIDWTTTLKEIK
jgi:hypothetical protein